ncbi:MAG: tetratricopeptide repeat protein [Caulobacteraceae bacterium]
MLVPGFTDFLGNPVTADSEAALAGVNDFVGGMLAYETRAANIITAAEQHPDCCLAQSYTGIIWMLLEAPEGVERARIFLAKARELAPAATGREQLTVDFLGAWADDDVPGALAIADEIIAHHPRDLLMAKLAHYHQFNRGDAPAMLRTMTMVMPHVADVAYAHGMIAFAYEQCHLLDDAEAAARKALSMLPKEPWAQHALAHVMLTQGRIYEGVVFMEGAQPTWVDLNSFMYTHLWWHLALFYLSQGREAEALAAYDDHCWGVDRTYSQDQIGAVSLLTRLELAGVDVGPRWAELADHLLARTRDVVQPFLTLQYLYGLARAGRAEADDLLNAIRFAADTAPDHSREVWRDVALPAAEGLLAHARGDDETTLRRLGPALPRMIELGGSHAQRDLFEQILLDATLRSGRLGLAQQMLEQRRAYDPNGAPLNRQLAEVYARLGLPDQAAQAAERVRKRLAVH